MDERDRTLQTLLESAAEGILITDRDGRIAWANRRCSELFGYKKDELTGLAVEILIPVRFRESHLGLRKKYLADPRNRPMGSGLDLFAQRKDGTEFPVEISLSYAGREESLKVMAFISDITERKQLEDAKAQLMKERIGELERILRALEEIARPADTPVTARMMGVLPLRESAPQEFNGIVEWYGRVLDQALEQSIYRLSESNSDSLSRLAARLGFWKATPRDVVDLHTVVIREKSKLVPAPRFRGYIEEGHFLLLKVIGELANYYRVRSFSREESCLPGGNRDV